MFSGSHYLHHLRNPARRSSWILVLALLGTLAVIALRLTLNGVAPAFGDSNPPPQSEKARKKGSQKGNIEAEVARGKYLVEGAAMCGECHTPRAPEGHPARSRWRHRAPRLWH